MQMQEHSISIIITARNGEDALRRLLDNLLTQTLPADEVIIVHGGRESIPEQLLDTYKTRLPIKYLYEPGKGISAARNRGVAASHGSIIAFLNDDYVPCEKWTEVIAHTFAKNPEIKVLQGNILPAKANHPMHSKVHHAEHAQWLRSMLNETPGYVNTINGRNFAIRAKLIRRFRMPFDERLQTNEDVEFYWRLRQEEVRVAFSEGMQASCYQAGGFASFLVDWYRYGVGKAHVMKIQDDFWDYYSISMHSPKSVLSWLLREVRSLSNRHYLKDLLRPRSLIDLVKLYWVAMMQRIAFVFGFLQGCRQAVPGYDHFMTPIDFLIALTNKCDLRCRHCYYHERVKNGSVQEINADQIEKMLESLTRDLRTVSMAGGEPFLNNHLVEICNALAERIHVKNVYIVTNGFDTSHIVETCERILEKANFNLYIRVSLDGSPDTHNHRRGNHRSHARAIGTINRLRDLAKEENRLRVEVQTTIGRDNFDELKSMVNFVAEELELFQAFEITRDSRMSAQIPNFAWTEYGPDDKSTLLSINQLEKVEEYVRDIYRPYVSNGHFSHFQTDFQLLLMHFNCQQSLHRERLLHCTAGESIVTILENCDVALCEMTYPIGNLAEFDFDLKHLLEERFKPDVKAVRDICYCPNSCYTSSSILTARMS